MGEPGAAGAGGGAGSNGAAMGAPAAGKSSIGFDLPPGVPSRVRLAYDDLAQNNDLNPQAWAVVLGDAATRDVQIARPVYEAFLKRFPTAGRHWMSYAQHEERAGNTDNVGEVLRRGLLASTAMELWRFYVDFTSRKLLSGVPDGDEEKVLEARAGIQKAFEFALDNVGNSMAVGGLLRAYIDFHKAAPESSDFLGRATSEKIVAVRAAYQYAVARPHAMLEEFWREYSAYETEHSPPQLAEEQKARTQPLWATAKSVYREARPMYDATAGVELALPPSPGIVPAEQARVAAWYGVLEYEKGNPLRLDDSAHQARVRFVYRDCLDKMRHYPDLWFERAFYEMRRCNDAAAAEKTLRAAVDALPKSQLLGFALADHLEEGGDAAGAKAEYERMITDCPASLVYIQYQRFARRTAGIKEARAVFKRARASPQCTHHVYTDNALLEFHSNKETKIARNVFELGLKRYVNEPEYVLHYIDFLSVLNDDNNQRGLFERVLSSMPSAAAVPVWDRFLEFEYRLARDGGDMSVVAEVERRRAAAYASEPDPTVRRSGLRSVLHRYSCLGLVPSGSAVDTNVFDRLGYNPVDRVTGASPGVLATGVRVAIPGFLSKLVAFLPDRYSGPTPDVDYVVRQLQSLVMPPRPEAGDDDDAPAGAKRRRGDDDAPPARRARTDLYQQRQANRRLANPPVLG